jgi:arylsulfatase A-like enzyme
MPSNLIYIFADQMHGFAPGYMEHPDARTPHIDALARRGTVMRNAYTCAPLCTPARITMFTGRYAGAIAGLKNDATIGPGIPTMAGLFREAGYLTSYVGKWHIGASGNVPVEPRFRADFEAFAGFQCYNEFRRDVCFFDEAGAEIRFEDRHRTDATFDLAIERLRAAATDGRPFLLCVSEQAPHYPCQPSTQFLEPFFDRPISRRPNTRDIDPYTRTFSPPSPPQEEDPTYAEYGGDLDAYLRRYHAAVAQVDAGVGRLVAELEKLGLAGNTHVVFSSDHGDMQGSHGLKNKSSAYEESVRIPFVAAGPGIAPGQHRPELVGTIDFLPTFAELCGFEAPPSMDGISFAPCLQGKSADTHTRVFSEDASGWSMVREGPWKLVIRNQDSSCTHLFDLRNDPFEMNDRVADPECENIRGRLTEVLRQWRDRTVGQNAPVH